MNNAVSYCVNRYTVIEEQMSSELYGSSHNCTYMVSTLSVLLLQTLLEGRRILFIYYSWYFQNIIVIMQLSNQWYLYFILFVLLFSSFICIISYPVLVKSLKKLLLKIVFHSVRQYCTTLLLYAIFIFVLFIAHNKSNTVN